MTVNEIFAQAKALFHYASDQCVFGKSEYWASLNELDRSKCKTGVIDGDCDDFASWCVGKLRAEGIPARYVICQVETGEWHCVCESDGVILDNRQSFTTPIDLLPYTWHSISGCHAGDSWHSIKKVGG